MEKGRLNTGDHVALIYPPGVDLIAAFYGWYATPLCPCMRLPRSLPRVSVFQPLRRRGARDDPAAAPAEPADDAADGADDRRRVQVGRGAVVATGHQAAQVEGGEQRRRYQGKAVRSLGLGHPFELFR